MSLMIVPGRGLLQKVIFKLSALENCNYDLESEFREIFLLLNNVDQTLLYSSAPLTNIVKDYFNHKGVFDSVVEEEIFLDVWLTVIEEFLETVKIMFGANFVAIFSNHTFYGFSGDDIVLLRI